MAFFKLNSTNPMLSYIIMKNPASGMMLRSFRKGMFHGWYTGDDTYNIYFKDGDDEISFGDNETEFEYNDTRRYNSPLAVMGGINEYLRNLTNKPQDEHDVEDKYTNKIIINQMRVYHTKYINILGRYLPEYKVTLLERCHQNYEVTIETTKSLRDLINFTYTLCLLYYCMGEKPYTQESELERFLHVLNNIDVPYFVKYVIKGNIIHSPNAFKRLKPLLDKSALYDNLDIKFGNTHSQRSDFILDNINFNNDVVDLGCGEMRSYGFKVAKQLNNAGLIYHAIDNNEEVLHFSKKKAHNRNIDNINFYNTFEEFMDCEYTQKFDYILSEVFEHVPLKQDKKWLNTIINKGNFGKIIVTTPNKDFNKHYLFENDVDKRLDDHVFEMTKVEFENFFNKFLYYFKNISWEFVGIGDSVNGEHATQAIIIKNNV